MRSSTRILAAIGLAVATAACGDDSPAKTTTPPVTAAPATTSPATTSPGTTSPGTTSPGTTPAMSAEQLHALVLTVADAGSGWKLGPDLNEADFTDSQQLPCPNTSLDPAVVERLLPLTGVQFEPSDRSYKHLIEFMISGEPKQLGADLQATFDAMQSCVTSAGGATSTTVGGGVVKIESLAIPDLGDQRAAYAIWGTESAGATATWYGRSAIVRVGGVAVQIGLTEILDTPQATPTITDAAFVAVVQAAVAHLPA